MTLSRYTSLIFLFSILLTKLGTSQTRIIPSNVMPNFIDQSEIKTAYNSYLKNAVSLEKYLPNGFVKNGSTDYTQYLQKGINENNVVILPDFPVLISDRGIKLKSNSVLLFPKNAKLILSPSSKDTYDIINIENVKDVKLFYPKIKGDLLKHKGTSGEWGMGISIRSSENIEILNGEIEECWGDGIYVGFIWDKKVNKLYSESKNIVIKNCIVNKSGRNGLSIVAVDGIEVFNSIFANSYRTFPKAGIDIEPGPKLTKRIMLANNVTYRNSARGIDIFLRKASKLKDNTITAEIRNHTDIGSAYGLRIAGFKNVKNSNVVNGTITIINPIFRDNSKRGVEIEKDQRFAPVITISNVSDNARRSYLRNISIKKGILKGDK